MTNPFDDATADALLSGRAPLRADDTDDVVRGLADLAMRVRSASTDRPRPNPRLAAVLEHGIERDHARSRTASAATPARRRHRTPRVGERVRGRLAALGVAAKVGIVGAAVLAATAGTGATGSLPEPLQVRFDAASPFGVAPERAQPVADAEHLDLEAVVAEEAGGGGANDGGPDLAVPSRGHQGPAEQTGSDLPELREPDGLDAAAGASQGRSEAGRQLAREARGRADEHRRRAAEGRPEHAEEEADEAGPPDDAGPSGRSEAPGRAEDGERPPHEGDEGDDATEEAPPDEEQPGHGPEEAPGTEQRP